jgi:hypothetical protein
MGITAAWRNAPVNATPRTLRWETLTKTQFDEIDPIETVVVLTCSPIEVHGPHLPLGADAFEGEGLAERMLRFLPERHRGRTFLKLPFLYAATDVVPQRGSLFFQPSTIAGSSPISAIPWLPRASATSSSPASTAAPGTSSPSSEPARP